MMGRRAVDLRFGRVASVWASCSCFLLTAICSTGTPAWAAQVRGQFTPLAEVRPKILLSSPAYPSGRHNAGNLIDGDVRTEYSSASKGVGTFVDFDLGQPMAVAGFRHLDRNDPATVARSRLTFSNDPQFGEVLKTIDVEHPATRAAETNVTFEPVTARYVRWQVTAVGPKRYGTVGGAEIRFFRAAAPETKPSHLRIHCQPVPALLRTTAGPVRPLRLTIEYPYREPADAIVRLGEAKPIPIRLRLGTHAVAVEPIPEVDRETSYLATVTIGPHTIRSEMKVCPVRHWELWFLPHSHNDIGYTHVQTEVERTQWSHLEKAIEIARRTVDYPPGARFRWNVEVMWAVDSYLKQASPQKRQEFLDAVRRGWIGLDALYGNQLTGLCRPEELFRLTDCARRVAKRYNFAIDSAMITDVPGYTWGIVPALAQSGVKYFSVGPNHIHRIGYTLAEWGDKPFWWVSPSGQERVLCWVAGRSYSWFHRGRLGSIKRVKPETFFNYLDELQASGYAYDMVQIRYSIHGDNGPPDPDLPDFVRRWNGRYVWPKLRIATTHELMTEFERRYGDRLPEACGDFTPYWEDGAGSSARETALARNAAERLVQAETLWALLDRARFPDADFYTAWRNVILYNEHTWGAYCSISKPDSQLTRDQWKIKQAFALDADRQSRELLARAAAKRRSSEKPVAAVDVYNTCSWPRDDLVVLPRGMAVAGDVVQTADGQPVPSQRLADGRLAFLARGVPPLGAKRFLLKPGAARRKGRAKADGCRLMTSDLEIGIDPTTGAVRRLVWKPSGADLAGGPKRRGLNTYHYVPGRDPKTAQTLTERVTVRLEDAGPLVASLVIESPAPGCRELVRRLRVVDGLPLLLVTNIVDKKPIRTPESVHFGFDVNVPGGVTRLDTPWAIIRPGKDQLPGACKNYFSVGRWVDVSNDRGGLTCAVVDAPLVEVGAIRVDVARPIGDPSAWAKHLEPTQTFYSYVMNNYWETNYKADQEGKTVFRYVLWPHGPFDPDACKRFGIQCSQPLIALPVDADDPLRGSLLRVEPQSVIVTMLKPSRDRRAWIVRLYNAGDETVQAQLRWGDPAPKRVALSDPFEEPTKPVDSPIRMVPNAIATLRAEWSGP
ncbi:MAG TPA: hypothetical protein EYP56_10560 [Planctomycetaceae bacterium]|nr:hypothetical protein [Planctomycetaceae bacterium]